MATNYVTAKIQEVYDLQTQDTGTSILKVHTPKGTNVKRHLFGFFAQFKQFRYEGARVTLVPASTLPADPLQLSYEAGETTIDPRDMVNPILWKHYHGEAMQTDLLPSSAKAFYGVGNASDSFGSSIDEQVMANDDDGNNKNRYARSLCDPSFRKSSIQKGFSVFVKPLAYNLVSGFQALANEDGDTVYHATVSGSNNYSGMVGPLGMKYNSGGTAEEWTWKSNAMFTNRMSRLGWMDTMDNAWRGDSTAAAVTRWSLLNSHGIPNLPMLYVMLPPAYKTEFYFRVVVTHFFAFRGFRSADDIQAFITYAMVNPQPEIPATASSNSIDSLDLDNVVVQDSADGCS